MVYDALQVLVQVQHVVQHTCTMSPFTDDCRRCQSCECSSPLPARVACVEPAHAAAGLSSSAARPSKAAIQKSLWIACLLRSLPSGCCSSRAAGAAAEAALSGCEAAARLKVPAGVCTGAD